MAFPCHPLNPQILTQVRIRSINPRSCGPSRSAWKGRTAWGTGATFAARPTSLTPRAKAVTAALSRVESIVIRRTHHVY